MSERGSSVPHGNRITTRRTRHKGRSQGSTESSHKRELEMKFFFFFEKFQLFVIVINRALEYFGHSNPLQDASCCSEGSLTGGAARRGVPFSNQRP